MDHKPSLPAFPGEGVADERNSATIGPEDRDQRRVAHRRRAAELRLQAKQELVEQALMRDATSGDQTPRR